MNSHIDIAISCFDDSIKGRHPFLQLQVTLTLDIANCRICLWCRALIHILIRRKWGTMLVASLWTIESTVIVEWKWDYRRLNEWMNCKMMCQTNVKGREKLLRPRSFSQDPILDLICSTPGMSGSMLVTHSLPVTILCLLFGCLFLHIPATMHRWHSLPAVRLLFLHIPATIASWQSRNKNTALISLGHVPLLVVLNNKCWSTTNTSHEIHCCKNRFSYVAAK
jgi:hypothetical protein